MKNIYEIGFLINPDFSQQEAEGKVSDMVNILEKNGASVLSEGEAVDIELAYQIVTKIGPDNVRFDEAYFAWVKFETETSTIEAIKKKIDLVKSDYFRYMVTKTIADDSLTDVYKKTSEDDEEQTDNFEKKTKKETKKETKDDSEEVKKTSIVKKVKKEVKKEVKKTSGDSDDLTKIEGIGPKIASVFSENNISTFGALAKASTDELKEILVNNSLARHNPLSWPAQSQMAFDGKWKELEEWQEELKGGI